MTDTCFPGRETPPDWNNPELSSRGRMPEHAYLIPFPDQAACLNAISDNQRYLSSYILHLSGSWDVKRFSSVTQMPEQILSHRSGFDSVSLPEWPENHEKRQFPFLLDYPHVPSDQPVHVYRRLFRLPLTWSGLRKRMVLQGVVSACHVFINGRLVGYSEGSGLPAEFDVTQHLHQGDNEFFLLIWPLSGDSYFEDQSLLTDASVLRDLYLEAVPPVSLYDLEVQTHPLEDEEAWQLKLRLKLISYRISMEHPVVRVKLIDQDGKPHDSKWPVVLRPLKDDHHWPTPLQAAGNLVIETPIRGITAWDSEQPKLYDLLISVEDRQGREHACYRTAVGFRHLSQSPEGYLLNGQPLRLHAVAWQEAAIWQKPPRTADMIRQIRKIKQHHINAILTSGLPVDPIFLELCDIYGLYVIESLPAAWPDVLSEMSPDLPARNRYSRHPDSNRVKARLISRCQRLIARDKNHPAILSWSSPLLRNGGQLKQLFAAELKACDPDRLWQYLDFQDITTPVREWHTPPCAANHDQPAQLRADQYAVSNKDNRGLPVVPGHVKPLPDGEDTRNDREDNDNDGDSEGFCETAPTWLTEPFTVGEIGLCLGWWLSEPEKQPSLRNLPYLLNQDGQPGSWLHELRYSLRPLVIEAADAASGGFTFINRLNTFKASVFRVSWVLLRNGHFKLSGELDPLRMPPGGEQFREIWYGDLNFEDGAEYVIRFDITLAAQWLWAGFGHEIAHQEFVIRQGDDPLGSSEQTRGHLRSDRDRHHLIVSGPRFWFVFNTINGSLESWRLGETEFFDRHPPLQGLKPLLDPECHGIATRFQEAWQPFAPEKWQRQLHTFQDACDGQSAVITTEEICGLPGSIPLIKLYTRYEITANGQLSCFFSVSLYNQALRASLPPLPGVYLHLPLRDLFADMSWKGKGPEPGLAGWQPSGQTGIFSYTHDQLRQLRHTGDMLGDCTWVKCESAEGLGLLISSDTPFAVSLAMVKNQQLLAHKNRLDLRLYSAIARPLNTPLKAYFTIQPIIL